MGIKFECFKLLNVSLGDCSKCFIVNIILLFKQFPLCVCVCACMHGTAIIIIIFDCILAICIYSLELEMFALLKFSSLFAGPVLVDFNVRLIMLILFLQMQCYC